MKKTGRRLLALLVVCLLVLSAGAAVTAAPPRDSTVLCELIVDAGGHSEAAEYGSWVADIYYVATVDGATEELLPYVEGGFGALDKNTLNSTTDKAELGEFAQQVMQIALGIGDCAENGRREPVATVQVGQAAEYLEQGLYLVIVHSEAQFDPSEYVDIRNDEYVTIAKTPETNYLFAPVLVALPRHPGDPGDTNPNEWEYRVTYKIKTGTEKTAQKKLILHKVSENGVKLPGAKFKLYATRLTELPDGDEPDTITVWVDNDMYDIHGYVTLYCVGEYVTDKYGDIIIDDPAILDESTLYAWMETEPPEGYELDPNDPNPHFFFAHGMESYGDYWSGTLLRYDEDNPNATGPVRMECEFNPVETEYAYYTFYNETDMDLPIGVRLRVYSCDEGTLDGNSLGSFEVEAMSEQSGAWSDEFYGDGWFYYTGWDNFYESSNYTFMLQPGESTVRLRTTVNQTDGPAAEGVLAGRAVVVYDYKTAYWDQGAQQWMINWDDSGYEEMRLSADAGTVLPLVESAHGGYVISGDEDLRYTGRQFLADECVYYWDYSDRDTQNGVTVHNHSQSAPPDDDGVLLPKTGGMGTLAFTVTGSAIIACAVVLLIAKRRRRA